MEQKMPALQPYKRNYVFVALLVVLGSIGCASLLFAPLETLLPESERVPRVAFLVQPYVLTLCGIAVGLWAAPKVHLEAPVIFAISTGQNLVMPIRKQLLPALIVAIAVAGVMLFYAYLTKDIFASVQNENTKRALAFEAPLITKVLFGGMSEELMARWGVMSVFVFSFVWCGLNRSVAFWLGCGIAALLFGAGHLPFLFVLLGSPPAWLIGMVVAMNAVPGILFGYLFNLRGLECAMLAHGFAHVLATFGKNALPAITSFHLIAGCC
jgi:membrane protease YdiL (CAAX protease family)